LPFFRAQSSRSLEVMLRIIEVRSGPVNIAGGAAEHGRRTQRDRRGRKIDGGKPGSAERIAGDVPQGSTLRVSPEGLDFFFLFCQNDFK